MIIIIAPTKDNAKAKKIICLFPVFSRIIPEGIENNPYAMKKDSGRKEASTKLKSKDWIKSGTRGPIIFVINEITKKIIITIRTDK